MTYLGHMHNSDPQDGNLRLTCNIWLEVSFISPFFPSYTHLDTEPIVCGCTMLLFACGDCEDVAVF